MIARNPNDSAHTENPDVSKKTICVMQLTRIGDVIQTYQACKAAKEYRPDLRLIFIGRKKFSGALEFLLREVFDALYFLDLESFTNKAGNDLKKIQENVQHYVQSINNENIDVLVNLSFSKSSGYLSSIIKANHKLGLSFNAFGNISITDPWSQYIYSSVMTGPLNGFSLVDIYKRILGVPFSHGDDSNSISSTVKSIVIHPFASLERKAWKPSKWVEIIYKLLKTNSHLEVTIVGAPAEKKISEEICSAPLLYEFKDRLKNCTGKTTIEDLFKILQSSSIFLGHDSMVGHLSACAKTPTITISLGSVRPSETTPYGSNNIVLSPRTKCFPCFPSDSCEHFQCHADITYQVTYSLVQKIIDGNDVSQIDINSLAPNFYLSSVNISKTSFSEKGLLQLHELTTTASLSHDIFKLFYRITWLYFLEQEEEFSPIPALTQPVYAELLRNLSGIEYLYELAEFGKKYSRYIIEEVSTKTPNLAKIKEFSEKIDEIDGLQNTVKEQYPYLAPLVNFFLLKRGNLVGSNIVQLSESSFYSYHDFSNISGVLYELIEKTLLENRKIIQDIKNTSEKISK